MLLLDEHSQLNTPREYAVCHGRHDQWYEAANHVKPRLAAAQVLQTSQAPPRRSSAGDKVHRVDR